MDDIFNMVGAIASGPAPQLARDDVELKEGGTVIVSTIDSVDKGHETAYLCNVDGSNETRIVERYTDRDSAMAGHQRWIEKLNDGERTFTDVGYGEVVEPFAFTLKGRSETI